MFTIRIKAPQLEQVAKRGIEAVIAETFDEIEQIFAEEGRSAPQRTIEQGFGPETDVPFGALRVRSGESLATIKSQTVRRSPTSVQTTIGSIGGSRDVQRYLQKQEDGGFIQPLFAEKLAYPPADATSGARDERGVQIFWAYEFKQEARSLGYAWWIETENALLARPEGSREFELIFIRADEVYIPARKPISKHKPDVEKRIAKRLSDLLSGKAKA